MNALLLLVCLAFANAQTVGSTPGANDVCALVRCGYGSQCQLTTTGAKCVCPEVCADLYDPVCGNDGKTYPNECSLLVQYCKTNGTVLKKADGECVATGTGGHGVDEICGGIAGFQCAAGLQCRYANGQTTPPPNTADAAGVCFDPNAPHACSPAQWKAAALRVATSANWGNFYTLPYATAFQVPTGFVNGGLKDAIARVVNTVKANFVRESVAAYLNAATPGFNFPLTLAQVVLKVQQSYNDIAKMSAAAAFFHEYNNAGNCPFQL
jgi:coxsackievirus/adenovirus receptor